MKKVLIILCFFYSSMLMAIQATELQKAQEQWAGFKACSGQIKNELELINCLSPYLSSKITRIEKGRLASLLIMEFSFSELRTCAEKDITPMKSAKNEVYFCMDVLGNKSKFPGYVTMEIEKKMHRIKTVKYDL